MIFFAESCWRLNIERKYFSGKVFKICSSLSSKFIFNVILLQKLQVFYSEDFQKKISIEYAFTYVDWEISWNIAFLDMCTPKLYLIMLFLIKINFYS